MLLREGPAERGAFCFPSSVEAAVEIGAAPCERGVRAGESVSPRCAHRGEVSPAEPALAPSLPSGPAVCRQLVAADVVVAALVCEHEALHPGGLADHQARVQDDSATRQCPGDAPKVVVVDGSGARAVLRVGAGSQKERDCCNSLEQF
jgi:hypothetical protein